MSLVEADERWRYTPELLTRVFQEFGRKECPGRSPLYAYLCERIAGDSGLLALAMEARAGQPVPNLFLGAIQYLLLDRPAEPLCAFYATNAGSFRPGHDDPFPVFRSFALQHRDAIAAVLRERLVQTAHVRRCALLLPGFGLVAELGGGAPLALVEIGASVGLNLLWDHYGYRYSNGRTVGDQSTEVQLECELQGEPVPLPAAVPPVSWRVGIDLNPIDVHDAMATRWLRALIWPDETGRAAQLERALAFAARQPPRILRGNALDLLRETAAAAPSEATLCVYHSFTLSQFSLEARAELRRQLAEIAARRPLFVLSIEQLSLEPPPRLQLARYSQGERRSWHLAGCEAHGKWLHWQVPVGETFA